MLPPEFGAGQICIDPFTIKGVPVHTVSNFEYPSMGTSDSGEPQHRDEGIRFVVAHALATPDLRVKGQQARSVHFAAQHAFAHELQIVVMLARVLGQK